MTKKEAPEFCAGVKILIERMETNPEDFDEDEYDYARSRVKKENKFSHISKMLDGLVMKSKTEVVWREWNYLSKEEQEALLGAYKQMRRGQFDKAVMERVFDEKFYERQADEEKMRMQQELVRHQIMTQVQNAQSIQPGQFQTITTSGTSGGLLNNIGLGGIFK